MGQSRHFRAIQTSLSFCKQEHMLTTIFYHDIFTFTCSAFPSCVNCNLHCICFFFLLCSECHHVPWTLLGCCSTGVMQLDCNWAAANPWEAVGILSGNGSEQTSGYLFSLTGDCFVLIWAIIHAMTHIKDIVADASH